MEEYMVAERLRLRAGEFKQLIWLMFPILLTQWFQVGMGVTDIAITGHYSDSVQASVGLGVMIWNPLLLSATGVLMSVAIFSAHEFGRGRADHVAAIWHNGVLIALLLIVVIMGIMNLLSGGILRLIRVEESLIPGAVTYLRALSIGVPAIILFNSLRPVCEGVARPLPISLVSSVGFVINGLLNYALVHGFPPLKIPSLGIVGSGLGTAFTFWIMFILLLLFTHYDPRLKGLALLRRPYRLDGRLKEMIRVGLPNGATFFAEVAIFSAAGLILGQFGAIVVSSHQISLSITSMTFMIPVSLSIALTALIGQAMGREDFAGVKRITKMGHITVLGIMMLTSLFLFLMRHQLPQLFNSNPEIVAMSAGLILYSIIFQIPDGLQIVANGVLRGMKDTKIPMLLSITSYWLIAFPLFYLLGVVKGMAAEGVWIGLIVGLTVSAILLNSRLWFMGRQLEIEKGKSYGTSRAVDY